MKDIRIRNSGIKLTENEEEIVRILYTDIELYNKIWEIAMDKYGECYKFL